jgi:hypothetical protein
MKPSSKLVIFILLASMALPLMAAPAQAAGTPAEVLTGVRLMNVQKVDLTSNTYTLDFYLWFSYDPAQVSLAQVKEFEFLNGAPAMQVVYVDEKYGFLEYRVKGDFVKTFDFSRYPFESQDLEVKLEHKNMNTTALVYVADPDSSKDAGVNVVGWDLTAFNVYSTEHTFSDNSMSNFVFNLQVTRPAFSSFVKNVLPVTIITIIGLLTFVMHPKNFGQRIGLAVSTLMAASAAHLSLLNALPPTGYLTLADRMMIVVYIIFLFNLASSVWIMRLVDGNKMEDAIKFNGTAVKMLVALVVVLIVVQLFV